VSPLPDGCVAVDVQATQSAAHRGRGIARYVAELAAALEAEHGEIVGGYLLNRDLAPPATLEPLVAGDRLRFTDAGVPRGTRLVHLTSPFELAVPLDDLWGRAARRLPYVVTLYDLIPALFPDRYLQDPGLRQRYRARLELVRAADLVLAISEATAADAADHLGIRPERLRVVGAAVSGRFVPPRSRAAALGAAGAAVTELRGPFVLYTGGLEDRKNFVRLFDAWAAVPDDVRRERALVVVCDLDEGGRHHLRSLAAERGIGDSLILTGYVADRVLRLLYQACDLFVFPSLYEGYGLPIVEAMACGAPTIGSDTSAMREVLDRVARFDPTDVAAMSRAIAEALTDGPVRAALVDQAARPRPEWRDVAARTVEGYEYVLGRRSGAARRRPLVAMVTPLPPAATGVADYSFRLIEALRSHCDVHAFADGLRWTEGVARAPAGVPVAPVARFDEHERVHGGYDCVIACVGNSEFHSGALALLQRRTAVVLAHDVRMTDLHALSVDEPGALTAPYGELLRSMYGPGIPDELTAVGRLTKDQVARYGILMARDVIGRAEHFAVMSEFAARLARLEARPADTDRIVIVPFGMPPSRPDARPAADREALVVAAGVVNEAKAPDLLVAAWPAVVERHRGAHLAFVGRCGDRERRELAALADALGVGDRVTITGDVSDDDYAAWLDRAALAVQLRATTNGECYASVADCLAAGLPALVSAVGSARELPDGLVGRVDADVTPDALGGMIADLLADPEARSALAERGRRHLGAATFEHAAARLFADVVLPAAGAFSDAGAPPPGPGAPAY
jgi:glycosyltransferase involved in cell wall biosynthesis